MRLTQRFVFRFVLRHKLRAAIFAQQARGYRYGAAGIEHVHHRLAVMRCNLHGRMRAAGGGAANQQRQLQSLPLHLPRHVHHLVERRRNQSAQPDNVCPHFFGALQNFFRGHHHAQVDDFEVIAGQHHAHDILADVVHVALDGCEHDLALRPHFLSRRGHLRLLRFHERR